MTRSSWRWLLVAGALAATPGVRAEGVYRYDWLTTTNLPGPTRLVEAALQALPRSVKEQQDWLARMRRAAWMPTLEFRYTLGEGIFRDYNVLDRVETTVGSEVQTESSRQSGSSSGSQTGSGAQQDFDALGQPAGSSSSSSEESTRDRSSTSGRRTTRINSESVTRSGPDSYATGESTRWMDEYGISLSWDLSRLIFQRDELAVASAAMEKETFRQGVKSQVIQAYYDLLETVLLLNSETYRESVPAQVKRERLGYLLDSLTNGALSNEAGREAP